MELVINNKGNNQITEIKPYTSEDDPKSKVKNTVSGKNGVRIDGNGWKGVNIGNYQVTANTRLTFINDDDRTNSVSWSAFRNVSFTNLTPA